MELTGEIWAVAASLFVVGLSGGVMHCTGMCSPFVMAQVGARLDGVPSASMGELHRLRGGLLVPYHLGRITTYTVLGVLAALLSARVGVVWDLRWLAFVLLVLAALFFTVQVLKGWGVPLPAFVAGSSSKASLFARVFSNMARPLFARPTGVRGYLLGVVLGFLPCGLVYGALAAAAATGSVPGAAVIMVAFSLGTVPALALLGVLGQLAATRLSMVFKKIAPVFLLFSAGFLIYAAWRAVGAF